MDGGGPNRGRGQSVGKCLIYEDLDAPESNDWLTLSNSGMGLGSKDTLSAPKWSKRANVNKKNRH